MNETDQLTIRNLVKRFYNDAKIKNTDKSFITLLYKHNQFKDMMDEKTFNSVLGFLPNMNYQGKPFILSVSFSRYNKEYEITVYNPRII